MTFNAAGQVTGETVITRQGNDTFKTVVTNQYGSGTAYALGAVTSSTSTDYKLISNNWSQQGTSSTANAMAWWDGAVTSSSAVTKSGTTTTTAYAYGLDGSLQSVTPGSGSSSAYTVAFTNDANGQVIARDRGPVGTTGPHELWYRYGGKQLGYTGNDGTQATDYTASVKARTTAQPTTPGPFRNGATTATPAADFDQSLAPINSYAQASAGGGSYEVRAGDTLAGIAAQLWGDSSLWFKLAEMNGLGANAALVEGQRLSIPAGVTKNTHNATTFNPYDPSEVIGDIGPAPKPNAKNKCGVFGAVILAAVAVAAILGAVLLTSRSQLAHRYAGKLLVTVCIHPTAQKPARFAMSRPPLRWAAVRHEVNFIPMMRG